MLRNVVSGCIMKPIIKTAPLTLVQHRCLDWGQQWVRRTDGPTQTHSWTAGRQNARVAEKYNKIREKLKETDRQAGSKSVRITSLNCTPLVFFLGLELLLCLHVRKHYGASRTDVFIGNVKLKLKPRDSYDSSNWGFRHPCLCFSFMLRFGLTTRLLIPFPA